jgi:hypothetical protein
MHQLNKEEYDQGGVGRKVKESLSGMASKALKLVGDVHNIVTSGDLAMLRHSKVARASVMVISGLML